MIDEKIVGGTSKSRYRMDYGKGENEVEKTRLFSYTKASVGMSSEVMPPEALCVVLFNVGGEKIELALYH